MSNVFKLIILLFLSSQALAISNIESERPGLPDQGWNGHIEFSVDGKTGNKREETYTGAAKVTWRKNNDILLGIVERGYGTTRNVKDTDESFVHTRWIHVLNPSWATEAFAQWEEDEFDNLISRTLAGGGGRYVVAQEQDIFSLSVGLGGFREREKLDLGTYDETNWTWRINSFYAYKHRLNDQVVITSTAYYQPSTDDFGNFRVLFDAALSVKLTDTLNLKVNYKVTHDSEPASNPDATPPIDNHETNTEYATSLVYNF
jgi:putative salt-induced outer membrane protein YdiY